MKVSIDHDRCTGHGRCYVTAPALFTDDDYGYGQVVGSGEVSPAERDAAELAVNACPEGAVSILE
jgi:ferredoxin